MICSAVTVCLVPEAAQGPFVFHGDLADNCARAAQAGFDAVEIFPRAAEDLRAPELKSLLEQHHLRLAAMGTGAGWVVRKLSLASPDPSVRRAARDFINAIIDLAGGFGAPAIIGSMQGKAEDGVTRERARDWLAEALEQLAPRAHAHGVPLLLEHLNRYETNLLNTVAETVDFLRPLRTRNVKLLCDLFHMNIEEASIPDALLAGGEWVGHVHFADSNRRAVGYGHTDIESAARALREMNYEGYISAEVFPLPDADQAARQTMESFRRCF